MDPCGTPNEGSAKVEIQSLKQTLILLNPLYFLSHKFNLLAFFAKSNYLISSLGPYKWD